jgi:hypothetical protein
MSDHDMLQNRLDALSQRIEASKRKFTERGELTTNIDADLNGFHGRLATISQKVNDAISKGDTWDIIRYELERDFGSLSEDFEQFEQRLDTEEMRRRRST